jgi:hypothetical protein
MVIRLLRFLVLVLLAALAGCSVPSSSASPPSRSSQSPRVRCLSDPNEGATRPLFFLFCAETP